MLSDFFFPQKTKNSAIMRIPHEEKYKVWEAFKRYPELFMSRYQSGGDQEFISKIYPQAAIWQDILPGQIVSYKNMSLRRRKMNMQPGMALCRQERVSCVSMASQDRGTVVKHGFRHL